MDSPWHAPTVVPPHKTQPRDLPPCTSLDPSPSSPSVSLSSPFPFPQAGLALSKTDVIEQLERGEAPWRPEGDVPGSSSSIGEWGIQLWPGPSLTVSLLRACCGASSCPLVPWWLPLTCSLQEYCSWVLWVAQGCVRGPLLSPIPWPHDWCGDEISSSSGQPSPARSVALASLVTSRKGGAGA